MTPRIMRMLLWIITKFPIKSQARIFLEGGLGSQILGMMQYKILSEKLPTTDLDITYFQKRQGYSVGKTWAWDLGEYGIPLPDKKQNLITKFHYLVRPRNNEATPENIEIWRQIARRRFNAIFPIHENAKQIMRELEISPGENFVAIHVRRGDYVNVSSKLIEIDEFEKITQVIPEKLQERVLVFSDDIFSEIDEEKIRSYCSGDVTFITGGDQHAVHGLMRCSSVLIASNSTFSLTAALLSEHPHQLVFAPTHFFSDSERDVNLLIQQLSRWMLIERPTNES